MIKTCSVLKTTRFIGKKWTLLIFLELYKGKDKTRFNELLKRLDGITPKVLTQRLNEMRKNKLVLKQIDKGVHPNASYYSLTPCGRDLIKITSEYKKWVLKWKTLNSKWRKVCSEQDCEKCEF